MKRDFARTKHPGIYAGALPGLEPDRYKVYYRLSGRGQRTKTFLPPPGGNGILIQPTASHPLQ